MRIQTTLAGSLRGMKKDACKVITTHKIAIVRVTCSKLRAEGYQYSVNEDNGVIRVTRLS